MDINEMSHDQKMISYDDVKDIVQRSWSAYVITWETYCSINSETPQEYESMVQNDNLKKVFLDGCSSTSTGIKHQIRRKIEGKE